MFLETQQGLNKEALLYKTSDTKKNQVYNFRKYKIIQSFGLAILNRTATFDNVTNEQVYPKAATDSFKKSPWPRPPKKN